MTDVMVTRRLVLLLTAAMMSAMVSMSSEAAAPPDGADARALMAPRSVEAVRSMVPEDVTWIPDLAYREGHRLWTLDIALPSAESAAPRPGVVLIHGGGWRHGDKRANVWARYPLEYAARGFVAVSVNYRLVPDDPFPACVEDVKAAVRWLRANAGEYNLDVDRIGAYGNSAGAHLALMLGLAGSDSDRVQAVVASAAPTDLVDWSSASGSVAALLASPDSDPQAMAALASPIRYVTKAAPPILLIHGTDDQTVPYGQAVGLVQALLAAGAADFAFRSYPGTGHGAYLQHIDETLPMSIDFFSRVLSR